MKVLRPTLREKRRWVLVEFLGGVPEDPVRWAVSALKKNLGEIYLARSGASVSMKYGKLVISVNRDFVEAVRAALVLERGRFVPRTIVAGTLEALRRKGFL